METERKKNAPPKILIVDDIIVNVKVLENIIENEGYTALCAMSVQEALDIMKNTMPQLILSDFSMPGMSGLEFCRLLKSSPRTRDIPFVFITVADSREEKKEAFSAGAVDFIPKPFEPLEVVMRVNNQLKSYRIKQEMEDYNRMMHRMVADQKKQLETERQNVLLMLSNIIGKRSIYKDGHLERVGDNCRLLAQSLQLVLQYENQVTDEFIATIGTSAQLHDIGNIVMPDSLLFKEKLSDEEQQESIRIHVEEGVRMLEEIKAKNGQSAFLDMAISIVRYHHAAWDGTGYPKNAKGSGIPLAARIVLLAEDFDALIIGRNGKGGLAVEESVNLINERSGTIYDPDIVEVFNRVLKQLRVD